MAGPTLKEYIIKITADVKEAEGQIRSLSKGLEQLEPSKGFENALKD